MLIKINKLTLWFIAICFFSMTIPYILDLGNENVFIKDFYSKRIMTFFALPFLVLVSIYVIANKKPTLNKSLIFYLSLYAVILIVSFLRKNSLSLIVTDGFIAFLPVFFYFLVYWTKYSLEKFAHEFFYFLLMSSLLVIFGIKLQFSYFSLISVVYLIFLIKWNTYQILLLLFLPILLINSLIGKSALIMLIFLVFYFFVFDKHLVSGQKKMFILLIPSILAIALTIIFWNEIQMTGSYQNAVYFLNHTDFSSLSFNDHSTGERLFEARKVLQEFNSDNVFTNLFGKGFGSTIDLSGTPDITVIKANKDIAHVRNIHMGVFAVLYRYGALGLFVYILFIGKMLVACKRILKKEKNPSMILSALYVIMLLFDSFISFPHMMSNFLFWLLTFVILKRNKELKLSGMRVSSTFVNEKAYF